jgi:hypothetical protein
MAKLTLELTKTTFYPDMGTYIGGDKLTSTTILIFFDIEKEEFHEVLEMQFYRISSKRVACAVWVRFGEYDLRGEGFCESIQHSNRLRIVQKAFDEMGIKTSFDLSSSSLSNLGFEETVANAIADTFKLNLKHCKVITT